MKIKRRLRFILSTIIAVFIMAEVALSAASGNDYSVYKSKSGNVTSFAEDLKAELSEENTIIVEAGETVDFRFNVSSDSVCNIYLSYAPLKENKANVKIGIKVDGEYPFTNAESIIFPTAWANETNDFSEDNKGNQLTPKQIIKDGYFTYPAQDNTGIEYKPYEFFLTAGVHTVTVAAADGVKLSGLSLSPTENELSYKEYLAQYGGEEKNTAQPIILQGENACVKTSYSIIPKSDTLSTKVIPTNPKKNMLNYIGGSSWQSPGERISWKFTAEKDGFYKVAFNYKQSVSINSVSYRHLTVDDKTPFVEARDIEFDYCTDWQYFEFGNGKEPYYIWLSKGEHTLTLEVTLGEKNADYYKRLGSIVESLNNIYLNIIKITGASPDINRDYELFNQIPDLQNKLKENHDLLSKLTNDITVGNGGKTSEMSAAFENMLRVIKNMIDAPYSAQDYVKNYYSAYSTLSSCLQDIKEMPLSIDYVAVMGKDANYERSTSFFTGIKYKFLRFVSSFSAEYTDEYDKDDLKTLTIWSSAGRDQVSALDTLIKQDFTPKTGIKVNLKMVNASLINGLMSNVYPDLTLSMSRTDPVNYGIRNALYDLTNFEDYGEVLKRFQKGAEKPYSYGGATYALPTSQTFYVMFYRTDIFKELNLTIPKTWSEFVKTSVAIQRKNMEVYLPYTSIATDTVNTGVGSISLFPTLMIQNELPLYNAAGTSTAINTPKAISVFDYWVNLYTDYKMQKTADFYNRMRMGIMPLGIAPYSTYFSFVQMAPEIQGKYSMALVPANDTTGSRAVAGGGAGCAIVNKSKKHEAAWEFLKWYTSADIQTEYSRRLESILGLVGRSTTSNIEALNNLDWDMEQLDILNQQWKLVEEIPEVPGSYYLIRSIDQAFWSVINGDENSKDAIAHWSASADAEIERKYLEYGKSEENR